MREAMPLSLPLQMLKVAEDAARLAVIVKGNPKFVRRNPAAAGFYKQLQAMLEENGYRVQFDAGKPKTMPAPADVWIGHSRGADRFRFAPPTQRTIAMGTASPDAINHPDDQALQVGQVPGPAHYILTPEMRTQLIARLSGK